VRSKAESTARKRQLIVKQKKNFKKVKAETLDARQSLPTRLSPLPPDKSSPYSIAKSRVPELIPVLGSQPAGDMSH